MLSEDVYDCAYGEEEGIFWYEEERADEEGAVVRYLVKDGQSWELKGVPCDGCEYPQMYSPEEECCYLVCYDAEEDEETEESGDMSGMFPDLFGQTEAQDDEKAATIEFPVEDEAYTGRAVRGRNGRAAGLTVSIRKKCSCAGKEFPAHSASAIPDRSDGCRQLRLKTSRRKRSASQLAIGRFISR